MAKEINKEPVLTVRDLEVVYYTRGKAFRAIKCVNFVAYRGETLGLVGESGSGKTTIGRTIVGINKVHSGQVYLGDRLIAGKEPNFSKLCKNVIYIVDEIWTNVKLTQKYLFKISKSVLFLNEMNNVHQNMLGSLKRRMNYLYRFAKDSIISINSLLFTANSLRRYLDAVNEFRDNMKEEDKKYYIDNIDKLITCIKDRKQIINEMYSLAEDCVSLINKKSYKNFLEKVAKCVVRLRDVINTFEDLNPETFGLFYGVWWLLSSETQRKKLQSSFEKKSKAETLKALRFKNALRMIETFDEKIENFYSVFRRIVVEKKEIVEKDKEELKNQLSSRSLSNEEKKDLINEYKIKKSNIIKSTKDKAIHKLIQMIYQDPGSSLNERMSIRDILIEGIINYPELYKNKGVYEAASRDHNSRLDEGELEITPKDVTPKMALNFLINKMMDRVNLLPEHLSRYPHEFSGGQRQRVGIARSLIMKPELIIADEPISALDVSIRAQVLNLLKKFREEHNLTYIFVAHDLSLMKFVADRVIVLYKGDIVEVGDAMELFKNPIHPYTKALLSAVPLPNPEENFEKRELLEYDYDTVHYDYLLDVPELKEVKKEHFVFMNEREYEEYKKEKGEK